MNKLTVLKVCGSPQNYIEVRLEGTLSGVLIPQQELSLSMPGELELTVGPLSVKLDSVILPLDSEVWLPLSNEKILCTPTRALDGPKIQVMLSRSSMKDQLVLQNYKTLYENAEEELNHCKKAIESLK